MTHDYGAFGDELSGRGYSANEYRYGFQNQETDPEWLEGAISFKYRIEDTRTGRFLSIDPLAHKYPHNSPYAFSENNVIHAIELEGLEKWEVNTVGGEKASIVGPYLSQGHAQAAYDATIDITKITPKDDYEKAILNGDITYNKNYGWVDMTHAFTDTKRKDPYVGVQNLWNQILNESGTPEGCYHIVTYKQDILVKGISIGVERSYEVQKGLSLADKKRVALTIFQDISTSFEMLQSVHPTSGSSFEPADLPSDMIGFYRIVNNNFSKEDYKKMLDPLPRASALMVYRQYKGTFTDSKYKNKEFTPKFFQTIYTPVPFKVPKELQTITPMPFGTDKLRPLEYNFMDF